MKIIIGSKYGSRRRPDYPSIAEQLDMLWHGMNENPSLRSEPFYSTIKSVKDKHEKPEVI